jgi:[acyl-carrier-protein] S-malonyltransferase
MKTAFIFPGQGSQKAGMGKDIAASYAAAGNVFERADAVLGVRLSSLCFEGPEEELRLTENTQPAILTTSIAILRVLEPIIGRPDFVAGHSLGEYSALVAAGSLDFEDAVTLVRERGRAMQQAVTPREGAMAAIMGCERETVQPEFAGSGCHRGTSFRRGIRGHDAEGPRRQENDNACCQRAFSLRVDEAGR